MLKGVVYVAHFYGERPSHILSELLNTEFTPEESILIDYESLKYISELNSGIPDEDSTTQKNHLQKKWQQEDMFIKHNMQKRKLEYERMVNKKLKKR